MLHQETRLAELIVTARDGPSATAISEDPFAAIVHAQAVGTRLLDLLEAVADALPNGVHPQAARVASRALVAHIPAQTALEERVAFPLLTEAGEDEPALRTACALALAEHETDRDLAVELAEALEALGSQPVPSWRGEAIGYLTRAFIETQRRHVAWEQAVLFPPARARFALTERQGLGQVISDYRHAVEQVLLPSEAEDAPCAHCTKGCRNSSSPTAPATVLSLLPAGRGSARRSGALPPDE